MKHSHTHTYTHTHTHKHTHSHTHIHTLTHTYTHTQIQAHKHTHMRARAHAQPYTFALSLSSYISLIYSLSFKYKMYNQVFLLLFFELMPPVPNYSVTRDVDVLPSYHETLIPAEKLTR